MVSVTNSHWVYRAREQLYNWLICYTMFNLFLQTTDRTMAVSNTSLNTTENATIAMPPSPQLTVESIISNVLFCLLAVMIVFGNSLVIGAFRVNRRLRTTTNLLLMSLALADMLIGSVSMPLWVYISITFTYRGPIYRAYFIFDIICGVSSILNLTAISLERCYALLSPIKHRNIRKSMSLFSTFLYTS